MHQFSSISNQYKNQKSSSSNYAQKKQSPFFKPFIQPKLTINQPNDIYEQEADAMADKVMRMPSNKNESTFFKPANISSLQRKCDHCEEEDKLQMKSEGIASAGMEAPSIVHDVINSGGQSLDAGTRKFFEPRFGFDFSNVKIHNNSFAAKSAQSINALAYTTGNNIVFNQNQFAPETGSGKKLLAHELTHVIQQKWNGMDGISRNKDPDSSKKENKSKTRQELNEELCIGYTPDPAKAFCDYDNYQKAYLRIAKEHAVRTCSKAIYSLSIPGDDEIKRIVNLIFHIDKIPKSSFFIEKIRDIRNALEKSEINCGTCYDKTCDKGAIAFVSLDTLDKIITCPGFFKDITKAPRYLIHEAAHLSGLHPLNSRIKEEFYCTTDDEFNYWDAPCPMDLDNLNNADAWSFFIDRVALLR